MAAMSRTASKLPMAIPTMALVDKREELGSSIWAGNGAAIMLEAWPARPVRSSALRAMKYVFAS